MSTVCPCPECGKKPKLAVGPGGFCFAICDSCGRSTWPAPLNGGTETIAAWNRMCERVISRKAARG